MVDDPPSNADLLPTEKAQEKERQRLFEADQCRHTLEYLVKSKADPNADTVHIVTARFDGRSAEI